MKVRNDSTGWGLPSIALHWLSVLLILSIAVIGLYMTEMPNSMLKLKTYALHKSLGLTILGLTALRLAWRLYAGAPDPVPNTARWQRRAASASHALMYATLILLPLSGWAYNSASNFALQWFGLINLPRLVPADPVLKPLALTVHNGLFWALMALVLIHASAALWHHLGRRDATLVRMLPVLVHDPKSPDPTAETRQ